VGGKEKEMSERPSFVVLWQEYFQLLCNRMFMSEHKYGDIFDSYPKKASGLHSAERRIEMYRETHNTKCLLDAVNFLLIETTCPQYKDATFRATDSDESPGRQDRRGVTIDE
jgi:hypothetical protein